MTLSVVNFLVKNVFCILEDPTDDSQLIGAYEFGEWVRDLPTLMAALPSVTHSHSHVPSMMSIATGHPIALAPASCHPSSCQPSIIGGSPHCSDGTTLPALNLMLNEEDEEEQQKQYHLFWRLVIAPSHSSSLQHIASMTDIGEEFESALQWAKDVQPRLGFSLGLAGAIIGEGSAVTVSSGPMLGCDIIVTPPHTVGSKSIAMFGSFGLLVM